MATTTLSLLVLPLELRQLIYSYLLVDDVETRKIDISIEQQIGHCKLRGLESIRNLVFVNRALHHETLDHCFGRFEFHLNNGTESVRFGV
jgi:hypothetical protein